MAHIPERMCVGCRNMLPKNELIRLVCTEDSIVVDKKQKVQARGVYLCRKEECIALAKKKKALSRSFKRNVPDSRYDELIKECNNG